jgi:hypothetical protein
MVSLLHLLALVVASFFLDLQMEEAGEQVEQAVALHTSSHR